MVKTPELDVCSGSHASVDVEVIGLFQDADQKKILSSFSSYQKYTGLIDKLAQQKIFTGKAGTTEFIRYFEKERSVLLIGLGKKGTSNEEIRRAGGSAWSKLCQVRARQIAVQTDSFESLKNCKSFLEGFLLGAYSVPRKQKKPEASPLPLQVHLVSQDKKTRSHLELELSSLRGMMEAVNLTRDWSNEPSNLGTPLYYAQQAKRLAEKYKFKYRVLSEADAVREKMGLFLGVGTGSSRENRFVVLEYLPKSSSRVKKPKTVALVGKGVTFDSGGISLKPANSMENMKHDMTGAATVMGALVLAQAWQCSNRIIAVLPFTENMPDGGAIQPGNVLTARSGKTVEIINTDAEGRLILADALDYVQDLKPDVVVDVATLTGAAGVALGKICCPLMGNDDEIIRQMKEAGDQHGERLWQLPLFEEYHEDIKSEYADLKNSCNDPYAGTIRGGAFLQAFIREKTRWAHLDIASMGYNLSHLSYLPKKGASGMFVRTLAQFACSF